MISNRTIRITALLLTMALMMMACDGGAEDSTQAAGAAQSEPAGSPATGAGDTANVSLSFGQQYDLGTLDPQVLTTVGDKQLSANIFEGLVRYRLNGDDPFAIEPLLATEWESSGDGTEWTFTLREGVQFHDDFGELTADDVVFSLERLVSEELASPNAELLAGLSSVEATGDYEVHVELAEPDPAFLDKLASWYTGVVSRDAVQERGADFSQDPVGTGPYQFESWSPGQATVLTAFADHWRAEPSIGRLEYVPVPDATTMYNAFEAGDVDIIQVTDPQRLRQYEQDESVTISSAPGLITRFFGYNTTEPPFDDPLVREAVTYAINRPVMIESLFGDISTPADSILAPDVRHVARGVVEYTYDPERARELLAEAGYADGVDVTFSVPNIDRFTEPATVIQQDLAAVGINAEIEVIEAQTFIAELTSEAGLQMYTLSRSQEPAPDRVLYTWFHSSGIPQNNWARIDDPEIDRWLDQATTTLDSDVRDDLFGQVQEKVAAGNYYYYIDHENFVYAVRDRVQGFEADPLRSLRFDDVTIQE